MQVRVRATVAAPDEEIGILGFKTSFLVPMIIGAGVAAVFQTIQTIRSGDKTVRQFLFYFMCHFGLSLVGMLFFGIFSSPCNPSSAVMTGLTGSAVAWTVWKSNTVRGFIGVGPE